MTFEEVLQRLRSFPAPQGWGDRILLSHVETMRSLHACVVNERRRDCLELGTGFGATTCVLAAALQEIGGGTVTTVDRHLLEPVNVERLAEWTTLSAFVRPIVEPLGYDWWLFDLLQSRTGRLSGVAPAFDLCFLDGAHEFVPDGLAYVLASKLLRPSGWMVLDDVSFSLRSLATWRDSHGDRTDRELDAQQVGMVVHALVRHDPDFERLELRDEGRVAWTRKRPSAGGILSRTITRLRKRF